MKKLKLIGNAFLPLFITTTLILLIGYFLFDANSTLFWIWCVPSIALILKAIETFIRKTNFILKYVSISDGGAPDNAVGDGLVGMAITFYFFVSVVIILIKYLIKTLS